MESNASQAPADSPQKNGKRTRKPQRAFPAATFEDALFIPKAILEHGAGKPVRRITLFQTLNISPTSGPSRQSITDAHRYNLLSGNYSSEELGLTESGLLVVNPDTPEATRFETSFSLAIDAFAPFKRLYAAYVGGKIPAREILRDALEDDVDRDLIPECIDTFLANARYLKLIQVVAGAERLFSVADRLSQTSSDSPAVQPPHETPSVPASGISRSSRVAKPHFEATCFLICPIGNEGSEYRNHSDLFLEFLIEPVMKEFGLTVVRADTIGKPGMITPQILEHIVHSKLVIADLSFHNPNVFYELSLRHVVRKPTVQLIRSSDKIPFDLQQYRTVQIDTSLYGFRPREEAYKAEIASHIRAALDDPDYADNPIVAHFASLRVTGL